MVRKPVFTGSLLALVVSALVACGSGQPATQSTADVPAGKSSALPVVATFSVLGDLVRQVGGDEVSIRTLVGPGGDAHTFEPTPADGVALTEAAIVFENGLGFEPWLDDLYSAAKSQATRVAVSKRIMPIRVADEDKRAGDEEHGEFDPHAWHDVANAISMVEVIRDALVAADPAHRTAYMANADAYLAQLRALDSFIVTQTNRLPEARRKLVTSHDTFEYFARRYGYEIVGTALGSVSTEAADPSARQLATLIEEIKAAGVPAIFAENVQNPGLMERIADEAGVQLGPPLYTDALGEAGDGDSYVKMMRYNAETIVKALEQ